MPGPLRLVVTALLSLGLLALLCLTGGEPLSERADAALRVTAPDSKLKPAPSTATTDISKAPSPLPTLLGERLLEPPQWRPPTLRTLLNTAVPGRARTSLLSSIPSRKQLDLEAPTGDYATLRPQQVGESPQSGARLQGNMFTLLRQGYSLSRQQQQNVALVPMSFDLVRGQFALHAESAGHYLIALHLSNPQVTSYVFHNALQRLEFEQHVIPVVTSLVEQDDTIQSGASFVVPCLLQLDADEWVSLHWYMWGGNVLFHALTVDRIG